MNFEELPTLAVLLFAGGGVILLTIIAACLIEIFRKDETYD